MAKMKEEIIFYKRAYEDNSPNALWTYMHTYFTKRYIDLIKKKLNVNTLSFELEYMVKFYCMGAVGMTRDWVLNDNITSSKTIVKLMFSSMPSQIKDIIF